MSALPRIDKRMREGSFYPDLGRRLLAVRIACGKTQREVAAHLDVSFQQVQKYENGADRIPIHRLLSLAGFFEVPLSRFFAASATP